MLSRSQDLTLRTLGGDAVLFVPDAGHVVVSKLFTQVALATGRSKFDFSLIVNNCLLRLTDDRDLSEAISMA
jgi:hypothetical protein